MLRSRGYLSLKPSQIAAAALILAINLSTSELAGKVGLRRMQNLNFKTLFLDNNCLSSKNDDPFAEVGGGRGIG